MSTVEDVAITDATRLAAELAAVVELRGGSAGDVRRELEVVWLQCAYLVDSGDDMKLLERGVAASEAPLVAVLANACDELAQVQRAAEIKVAVARGAVSVAQGRLDEFRRGLVQSHAALWRQHAEELRRRAEEAGDETIVVPVVRYGGPDGAVETPELRYRRVALAEAAAAADQKASWLDGYLLRGDALDSQTLSGLVAEMVLPEAAETVAA